MHPPHARSNFVRVAFVIAGGAALVAAASTALPGCLVRRAEAQTTGARCAELQQRFAQVLAAAPGRCRDASECGCYNPVAPGTGCGGVTDALTARRLGEIQAEFLGAGCRWPVQCGPQACRPQCVAGRCQ
jgi:hypothetical protein